MENVYKEINKKLNIYKLDKIQKAMFYQQIQDVVEQMEEEVIDDEFLEDLINDIFEYNNIEKNLLKKENKLKINNIVWGLIFILIGILIVIFKADFWQIFNVMAILLAIYLLTKRLFFLSILVLFYILNAVFNIGGISVIVGLTLGYIGFKILFSKKKEKIKYYKFENSKNYKNYYSQKHQNFYTGDKSYGSAKDNEVLFINNNYNGMNLSLINENVNYLNLQNKCGGIEIDLMSFEFPKGDLVINLNNKFGAVNLLINDMTEVKVFVDSSFGGVGSKHEYKSKEEIQNKVYIQGNNKFGGIDIK